MRRHHIHVYLAGTGKALPDDVASCTLLNKVGRAHLHLSRSRAAPGPKYRHRGQTGRRRSDRPHVRVGDRVRKQHHDIEITNSVMKAYWDEKEAAEKVILQAGLDRWTMLKPAFFMDNYFLPSKIAFQFPSRARASWSPRRARRPYR